MAKTATKKILKAIAPYGAVVLYGRYRQNRELNYCPICDSSNRFSPASSAGVRTRQRAVCSNCGSLERHRLTWLFVDRYIGMDKIKNKSMLHVAPESSLRAKFSGLLRDKYLSADMYEKDVDVKMDITNIKYPNSSFDFVMANHVLEHVSNDIRAMKELNRVQKRGGWSILLAPIANQEKTYEDSTIKTKKGRLKAFGQEDHVRKYGRDYEDRLRKAGYKVEKYSLNDIAKKSEIKKMSLAEIGDLGDFTQSEIYFCTKDGKKGS